MTDEDAKVIHQWVMEAWDAGYGAAMAWAVKAVSGNITSHPANPYTMNESNDA